MGTRLGIKRPDVGIKNKIEKRRLGHLGYKHTDIAKRKIGEARIGEKHWNWKGGVRIQDGYQRERLRKLRLVVIEALGGKCVRCGFTDKRALQIDHINGDGYIERKKVGVLTNGRHYKEVLRSFLQEENRYQLLCANCNWIKVFENKEYLHRENSKIINN